MRLKIVFSDMSILTENCLTSNRTGSDSILLLKMLQQGGGAIKCACLSQEERAKNPHPMQVAVFNTEEQIQPLRFNLMRLETYSPVCQGSRLNNDRSCDRMETFVEHLLLS
jgi:hypothetical protein